MHRRAASRLIGGVTLGWLACFAYLTLSPEIPDVPGLASGDRVLGAGHLVASLILAALVYLWLVITFPDLTRLRTAGVAFGAASAFGLLVELVQFPVPEREPQIVDAVLDIAGSALAVAALAAVSPPILRRPRVPVLAGALGMVLIASTTAVIAFGSTDTPAEARCPGTVSSDELPSVDPATLPAGAVDRVDAGLIALLRFDRRAAGGTPDALDLVERGPVEHIQPHGVRLTGDAVVSTPGPAREVADSIVDDFTVEAWVRPTRLDQSGPARIVSSSDGADLTDVNFHLGQDRHCLSLRLDTGRREAEWLLLADVFDRPQPAWHLVATYDSGTVRVYVDGEPRLEEDFDDADVSGWSRDYPLLVGNEATRDRPFEGEIYLVAVYERALGASEVARNHSAGI